MSGVSLETKLSCIPRQELKRQLETPFEGSQLVDITAEASVTVIISRAKLLQAKYKPQDVRSITLFFPTEQSEAKL